VNTAIHDQRLQGAPGNLTPDRIEAGNDDGVRSVVDDDVHPGCSLECSDIPPLPAYDAPLHLIARQRHGRHGALRGVLRPQPLDGHGNDALGITVGGASRLLLDIADQRGSLSPRLVLYPLQDLATGILRGETRDPLELDPLLLDQAIRLAFTAAKVHLPLGECLLPVCRAMFAKVDLFQLPLLRAGSLLGPSLEPVPFLSLPLDFAVQFFPELEGFHFAGEKQLGPGGLGFALGLSADPLRLAVGQRENPGGAASLIAGVEQHKEQRPGKCGRNPREHRQEDFEHLPFSRQEAARDPRLAGGRSRARSSAMAESRSATSRSPRRAWKSSSVMESAARMAAL
jgi:hypothetical protein